MKEKVYKQNNLPVNQANKKGEGCNLLAVLCSTVQMIELALNFPYIREFVANRGIVDLHSVCPPCLVKKRSSLSSAHMIADMTGNYFHDASPSMLF